MKKSILLLTIILLSLPVFSADYYFSSSKGNDNNDGLSIEKPLKNIKVIEKLKLQPGDKLLLKGGDIFEGNINLRGVSGSLSKPIMISSYGDDAKLPVIDAKGYLNGILIEDCSHIKVSNVEVTANGGGFKEGDYEKSSMRCGVFITTAKEGNYSNITIEKVFVRDVFFEEPGFDRGSAEVLTGNGNQKYGWGIRIISRLPKAVLSDITIKDCHVKNVAHSGIRFTGNYGQTLSSEKNIRNAKVINNSVEYVGGPAMQASVVYDVVFRGNQVDHSGSPDDSRKWGRGSGLWVWGCINAMIEHNSFRNANGPGDSAGCHIDFNNKNVIIQYNLSENNAGGFVEVLGNNHNCTYRYNVSINDGWRKHEEGKTLGAGTMMGVNGFVGFGKKAIGGFNLYIYNNTIFAKEGVEPEVGFASSVSGVLIANNIIYSKSKVVPDMRKNFLPKSGPIPNVVFKNNLYLKKDNWPEAKDIMITDSAPFYGDPQFVNAGGLNIKDYIPQNKQLVKDKGIEIEMIPGDSIGLWGGLKVKADILGNKIKGNPDMGAFEIK